MCKSDRNMIELVELRNVSVVFVYAIVLLVLTRSFRSLNDYLFKTIHYVLYFEDLVQPES